MGAERRRGMRLAGSFWVRIVGVEPEAILRPGDISVSGALFHFEREIGPPGTVERLEIADEQRLSNVMILTRLVRTITVQDLWLADVPDAVAFEFIEHDEVVRSDLAALIRTLVERQAMQGEGVRIDKPTTADVAGTIRKAQLASVAHKSLFIETTWPVERGTAVRLQLEPPTQAEPIEVEGIVKQTRIGKDDHYRVEVSLTSQAMAVSGSLETALTSLLAGLVPGQEKKGAPHPTPPLMGALDRVPLPTLLQLLEVERMTGVLHLTQPQTRAEIYLVDGQVIDVESSSHGDPRQALRFILACEQGSFRLAAGDRDRQARFTVPTTALVLELLREIDEARR